MAVSPNLWTTPPSPPDRAAQARPLADLDLVLVDEKTPAEKVAALRDHGAVVEVVPIAGG